MKDESGLLDDLAPRLKREKRVHKYQSTKGLPVAVAVKRQAAMEASAEDPLPRLRKDAILMKYGVIAAVIEREIRRPTWKDKVIFQHSDRTTEVVWNSMVQDWFKATKGMTIPQRTQQRSSGRGYTNRHPNSRPELGTLNKPIHPTDNRYQNRFATGHPKQYQNHSSNRPSSATMDRSMKSPQN